MEETREPLPPRPLRPRAGQAGFFCEKLTAAINHAKDRGDLETLRQIAGDPHGFILRQGWASLDFREEEINDLSLYFEAR